MRRMVSYPTRKSWAWPSSLRLLAYISTSNRPRGTSTATLSKLVTASPVAAPASVKGLSLIHI